MSLCDVLRGVHFPTLVSLGSSLIWKPVGFSSSIPVSITHYPVHSSCPQKLHSHSQPWSQPMLSGPSSWGTPWETCVEYSAILCDTRSASQHTPLGTPQDGMGGHSPLLPAAWQLPVPSGHRLSTPLSIALQLQCLLLQQLNPVCNRSNTCRTSFTRERPTETHTTDSVTSLQNSASYLPGSFMQLCSTISSSETWVSTVQGPSSKCLSFKMPTTSLSSLSPLEWLLPAAAVSTTLSEISLYPFI